MVYLLWDVFKFRFVTTSGYVKEAHMACKFNLLACLQATFNSTSETASWYQYFVLLIMVLYLYQYRHEISFAILAFIKCFISGSPVERQLLKLCVLHIINHLLLSSTTEGQRADYIVKNRKMPFSSTPINHACTPSQENTDNTCTKIQETVRNDTKQQEHTNLNLKDDPRLKRTGLGLGLGSSKSLKNAWYSTQIFQKTLQQSLLAITNSRVS